MSSNIIINVLIMHIEVDYVDDDVLLMHLECTLTSISRNSSLRYVLLIRSEGLCTCSDVGITKFVTMYKILFVFVIACDDRRCETGYVVEYVHYFVAFSKTERKQRVFFYVTIEDQKNLLFPWRSYPAFPSADVCTLLESKQAKNERYVFFVQIV